MTMALLKRRPAGSKPVIAADFAREMLARGARKFSGPFTRHGHAIALEADALHLPCTASRST
jgi:demethylmenaquinone methyltransferase/2-methoxy-6-polyprenyl-1,4-benzoquinol methylase